MSSDDVQVLQRHEKLDALLLSHLIAQHQASLVQMYQENEEDFSNPMSNIFSLLPQDSSIPSRRLPLCLPDISDIPDEILDISNRFPNNNFVVHTYLDSVAHGIISTASRLFNHFTLISLNLSFSFCLLAWEYWRIGPILVEAQKGLYGFAPHNWTGEGQHRTWSKLSFNSRN